MDDYNKDIGIAGIGAYIPKGRMTARDISERTKGVWAENAVIKKLGIVEKPVADKHEGTQFMAAQAAQAAIDDAGIDPLEIDLVIDDSGEWKEYPITTSSLYTVNEIKANNAWGFDYQQRCCSFISALKVAKDLMIADPKTNCVLLSGGYRDGDLIDFTDKRASMFMAFSDGAGAVILKKNHGKNLLLDSYILADACMARDAGMEYGGIVNPIDSSNLNKAQKSLTLLNEKHMKERLGEVAVPNYLKCIKNAFSNSSLQQEQMDYLAISHFKPSLFSLMLEELGLTHEQTVYLDHYGHIGQIDPVLSLKLGIEQKKIKDGTIISMVAAGLGYVWAANVVRWG